MNRRWHPKIGPFFLLTALFAIINRGAPAVSSTSPPRSERFGLCFVSSAEAPADSDRYEKATSTGAIWNRWPFYWDTIEKSSGQFDWSAHDAVVIADIAQGFKIDAILLRTPHFYATSGLKTLPPPRIEQKPFPFPNFGTSRFAEVQRIGTVCSTSPPRNLYEPVFDDGTDIPGDGKSVNPNNYWARFVYETVRRYKPGGVLAQQNNWPPGVGISHWEVWNEPDYSFFWSGSVEDYYRLLKVAYLAAKLADPDCFVLLGGLAIGIDPSWFPNLLQVMANDPDKGLQIACNHYFDVLAIHVYSHSWATYYFTRWASYLLRKYNLGEKPIWINESGVPVWNDYPGPAHDPNSPYRATMEEQAAYVIQNFAYGLYAGAEKVFHFQLYDDCGNNSPEDEFGDAFGLMRNRSDAVCFPNHPNPNTPRPSYTAYKVASFQFAEVVPLWRYTPNNKEERIAFYRPSTGERVLVLWATVGSEVSAKVSATGDRATLISQDGSSGVIFPQDGFYFLDLPAATNQNLPNDDAYMIGGRPYILVEKDTLPPSSWVKPLPDYSASSFTVSWEGRDPGSGIASYDVWYNEDGGPLQFWMSTSETNSIFNGEVGHTYGFAVRARDNAGNQEDLPSAIQASTTTLEGETMGGRVTDNTEKPVFEARVTVRGESGEVRTYVTDGEGKWITERLGDGVYWVEVSAPSFGKWPARRIILKDMDIANVDLYLPPIQNIVSNGDFEHELQNWILSGSTPAQVSDEAFDGKKSLVLGRDFVGQPELGGGGNSTVHQTITIPGNMEKPTLSFMYKITTDETMMGSDWFEAIIIEGYEATYLISPGSIYKSTEWEQMSFDLSRWRGRTVDLYFNVWQSSAENPTIAYVDEVSVGPSRWKYDFFLPLIMKSET